MEVGAAARLALDPDLTPHELAEPLADGKAEPRATGATRLKPARLGERAEQLWDLGGGDAWPRVADPDVDLDFAFRARLRVNPDKHLSALGELDRVAHEIQKDLAKPALVCDNQRWHGGLDVRQ